MKNSYSQFALKEDLDMLTDQIIELKKSYGHMDFMVKVWEDCRIEQLMQSRQMERLSARMDRLETMVEALMHHFGLPLPPAVN